MKKLSILVAILLLLSACAADPKETDATWGDTIYTDYDGDSGMLC